MIIVPSQKCCAESLSVCPTPGCIRTHKNDHVRMPKIQWSMSEFGGLRNTQKNKHALVGLGSAALTAAVAVPRNDCPNYTEGRIKCIKKKRNDKKPTENTKS